MIDMIFNNKQGAEAEKITIKVNNQDLLCEKNKYTRYYPSGAIQEIKVCEKQVKQQINNNTATITQQSQPISFTINGEKQILELTGNINLYENGNVRCCNVTTKTNRILVNIAGIRQSIKIREIEGSYCYFHSNGNLLSTQLQNEAQQLKLEIGDIKQTLDVKLEIYLYDNGKLEVCYIDKPTDIECYINGKKIVIKLDNYFDKKTGFFENIRNGIFFFPDGTLKEAKICEDINLNVKFHGKDYNLPFKNGDEIIFNDNKELSQACIDNSPERSAVVYDERLNKLEESQKQTNQEVRELQKKVATRGDWVFVAVSIFISACCFYFALWLLTIQDNSMVLKPFADTVSFNKYTFFYEILKRTPIFISLILGFKFLQLAFERLRLIGDVEKVKKYLNLAKGDNVDNVKNNLLSIIAIPFFAQNKVKSRFFDRLIDKISINIGSERENSGVISKEQKEPLNDVEKL